MGRTTRSAWRSTLIWSSGSSTASITFAQQEELSTAPSSTPSSSGLFRLPSPLTLLRSTVSVAGGVVIGCVISWLSLTGRGPSSGQKLPHDWEEQVKSMAKRVSGAAARYGIVHGCFIINFDQTGVRLMQTAKYTYDTQGAKQVPITGNDDKRQITAVVGSSLDGGLLPLQLIFAGQEHNKKQHKAVPRLTEIVQKRVDNARFHLTQTPSHWSTLESMKDYIRVVIQGWVRRGRLQSMVWTILTASSSSIAGRCTPVRHSVSG